MTTFKKMVEKAATLHSIQVSPEECQCLRTEIRARTIRGGSVQYVRQCLDCGEPQGNPVRQAGNVPAFDEELRQTWRERRIEAREQAKAEESARWWGFYREYMESPEWFAMRQKVLKRDGYVCRGCLEAKATEVHHMTYVNFGSEFAFQLMSLCRPCHERYHAEDRDE